ncbi:hypothetical protein S40288_08481 [Stachybotrys chartarum IBT 40288]|nr:hypothetical protein S40288_08481 [Stachybotrys chartarum IBT 40288]
MPIIEPLISIPRSDSAVNVRVIDTNTLVFVDPKLFWQPAVDGFHGHHAPIYCFLISNGSRHVVFDLGTRPDWHNYAPKVVSLIQATTIVTPGTDVATILNSDTSGVNIRSEDIEAVIWSHNHFDHIGDVSTFPPTTELVVGPGVSALSWPGWPRQKDAIVRDSDAEGRHIREVSFSGGLKIGRFDAFDFFGDGSFYLLDAPGHAVGHICGLARTTAGSESSFVFIGADACHHPGVLRPSKYLPLPSGEELDCALAKPATCPGAVLQSHLTSAGSPFFTVSDGPLFPDREAAHETVQKIQDFDVQDNILVLIAHDLSLRSRIPFFPKTINQWKLNRLKIETRWLFCNDLLK